MQILRTECIDDPTDRCAGYRCNACGQFPNTCENCSHGEEQDHKWDEEEFGITCELHGQKKNTDTCSDFRGEYA